MINFQSALDSGVLATTRSVAHISKKIDDIIANPIAFTRPVADLRAATSISNDTTIAAIPNSTASAVSTTTVVDVPDSIMLVEYSNSKSNYSLLELNVLKDTTLSHQNRHQFAEVFFERTGVRRDKDALARKWRELTEAHVTTECASSSILAAPSSTISSGYHDISTIITSSVVAGDTTVVTAATLPSISMLSLASLNQAVPLRAKQIGSASDDILLQLVDEYKASTAYKQSMGVNWATILPQYIQQTGQQRSKEQLSRHYNEKIKNKN